MSSRKTIGLVAHDACKEQIVEWAVARKAILEKHNLVATGTTGTVIREATGLPVHCLKSGPLGGDAQIGAMIAEKKLDVLIFFIDAMSAMPHDVDVKALTRLATLYDVVFACNRATADHVIESPLFGGTSA